MRKYLFILYFLLIGWGSQSLVKAQEVKTDFEKFDTEKVLTAYPNPTKGSIYIKTSDNSVKILSVTFYSILGTKVASYKINANAAELNLEKLRPGKYLMKYALSDKTQRVQQIIKQ